MMGTSTRETEMTNAHPNALAALEGLFDGFTAEEMAHIRACGAEGEAELARQAEYEAELAACAGDSFAAYWAGSASASVMRDYRAGRVVTVGRGRR